jgi:glycosyltransferase involved in cell wall biosynthesis
MKLLIVATVSTTIKAFLLPFSDHFRSLGWRVDAASHGIEECSDCVPHFDRVFNVDWSRRPWDHRNFLGAIRKIQSLVRAQSYDIVHVHTPVAAFLSRAALRSFSSRTSRIYTAHGFHFHPGGGLLRNSVFQSLEKFAGHWTDFLITINRTDEVSARRLRLVPDNRIVYMPGIGIDRDRFRPDSVPAGKLAEFRTRTGIPPDAPLFTCIAEFIPRKRHQDVLSALARAKRRDAHLILLGDGPVRAAMEAKTGSLGIQNRVHFLGNQEDVRPAILAARATVLASSQEGLPRAILESLSCGVPVAGSDIRGTRDLLSEGTGRLFAPGDFAMLASHLDWFAENGAEAGAMGTRGRHLMKDYDLNRVIALHEELYRRAMPPEELAGRTQVRQR